MKLVHVSWVDSGCEQGWQLAKDALRLADENPLLCETVGWVLADNERYLLLVPNRTPGRGEASDMVCDAMQIPVEAIREVRTLSIGRKR